MLADTGAVITAIGGALAVTITAVGAATVKILRSLAELRRSTAELRRHVDTGNGKTIGKTVADVGHVVVNGEDPREVRGE